MTTSETYQDISWAREMRDEYRLIEAQEKAAAELAEKVAFIEENSLFIRDAANCHADSATLVDYQMAMRVQSKYTSFHVIVCCNISTGEAVWTQTGARNNPEAYIQAVKNRIARNAAARIGGAK